MSSVRVLLAGESWVSSSTHFKGWDFFSSTVYETGTEYLDKVLVPPAFAFQHMPSHLAASAPTHFFCIPTPGRAARQRRIACDSLRNG